MSLFFMEMILGAVYLVLIFVEGPFLICAIYARNTNQEPYVYMVYYVPVLTNDFDCSDLISLGVVWSNYD